MYEIMLLSLYGKHKFYLNNKVQPRLCVKHCSIRLALNEIGNKYQFFKWFLPKILYEKLKHRFIIQGMLKLFLYI